MCVWLSVCVCVFWFASLETCQREGDGVFFHFVSMWLLILYSMCHINSGKITHRIPLVCYIIFSNFVICLSPFHLLPCQGIKMIS